MNLNVSPLSQRDPRWKDQRLGMKNGTTIGSDGCVITSASMLYTYYGKPTTPDQLDNFLTDNGLYYDETGDGPANDNLWVPNNVSKWLAGMKFEKVIKCPDPIPAPIAEIKSYLDSGKPVFVWLMNNGVFHCTLAVGYEGDEIVVNDPWKGDTVRIDQRWGPSAEKILEVDFYSGPATQTDTALQACLTQHTALVDELEALKKSTSEALNKDKETISSLNITLTTKNQEIKNRVEQVERITRTMDDGFEARDKKIEALTKLIIDSGSGIASYQDQIKTLQSQYDNEAKAKGEALLLLATSEEKAKQLVKQISEDVVDYKTLSLKERIKVCVDILFT